MDRRLFFRGSAQLLTGVGIAEKLRAQAGPSRTFQRVSRLFPARAGERRSLADVVIANNLVISLHRNGSGSARSFMDMKVSAARPDGTQLWEYPLPAGVYVSLGVTPDGSSVFVQALAWYPSSGTVGSNVILRLNPANGDVAALDWAKDAPRGERMHFVGGSHLVRISANAAEVWTIDGRLTPKVTAAIDVPPPFHVDCVGQNVLAITSIFGTRMSAVKLTSAEVQNFEISSPILAQSRSIVQEMRQRNPPPGGRQAHIASLPVTGGDNARGLVYGLVVPSGDDRGYPIITITTSGIVSSLGFFDLALGTTMKGGPFRLLPADAELGVAASDGTVGWLAV